MRTGNRRSAETIMSRELRGILSSLFVPARMTRVPSMCQQESLAVCGRVRLSSDVSEIKLVFSIPPHRPNPNIVPSWNVAPTDPVPVVRYDAKACERSL
jgi:hypothetical protein